MDSKKKIRDAILKTAKPARYLVTKNPKLKRVVRNIILETINVASVAEVPQYKKWIEKHYPDAIDLMEMKREIEAFKYTPLISILTPTYNTNPQHLYECIASVQAQAYENWEICIVDDCSPDQSVRDKILEMAKGDPRITYSFRKQNGHISKATNDALAMAKGEFIGLLDHDDILWPNALYEAVKLLNEDKTIDFIYSDEDKIEKSRHDHMNPFFKPDWNPEFLESVNYITHFAVLRKALVKNVGGFRSEYNGAQDWDLFLRAAYQTTNIRHIPTVLYSWRMSETSTAASTDAKPYVREAQCKAIQESLNNRGVNAKVVHGSAKDYWGVEYAIKPSTKVSIVIPSKDQFKVVKRCIESIYDKTTYKNFEVVLIDTGSKDPNVLKWYKALSAKYKTITVLDWPEKPFSYSRSCNFGAENTTGDYLVMLNNDTEILTPNWIELLLGDAQRSDVGAVGCLLYYPDGKHIQHAGIGIGLGGLAANLLSPVLEVQMAPLQHLYGKTRHEVSAVTAACLLVEKAKFQEVGGFDEKFRITYNDVDLCLRLGKAGYRSIYNPAVQLLHHESISVGLPNEKKKRDDTEFRSAKALFIKRWGEVIANDPHLNKNIRRENALLEIIS